jgi:hypothetical protein
VAGFNPATAANFGFAKDAMPVSNHSHGDGRPRVKPEDGHDGISSACSTSAAEAVGIISKDVDADPGLRSGQALRRHDGERH